LGFSECFHNQLPAFDLQTVPVSGILDLDHVGGGNAPGSQGSCRSGDWPGRAASRAMTLVTRARPVKAAWAEAAPPPGIGWGLASSFRKEDMVEKLSRWGNKIKTLFSKWFFW
jgi:hypothetical protein